ncbi:hypothetical protein A4A49_51678 [Nicotiana attenuata]|uniref:Reverse transcriptase domain-containing protein n=1 Tax=Nicotiana attenuata TaxID=49451 RepID=A0A314KT28_NICAT|nr:hypothetical protein A4A49_51678 [Nicotiana attenuata]
MVYVTSPKFLVNVNGESYGYFERKRGLRHDDPASPLLFVRVMDYLSRLLKCVSSLLDFRFHPMCKQLKLTHLIFFDDMLIFCKADNRSFSRVMEALTHFSNTSGLVENMEKSNIFMDGIEDHVKEQLLAMTGSSLGTFPIRYFGFPLSPKKWNKLDYKKLIKKTTYRIKFSYLRQLSYAGSLQIVNLVLFLIHSFWGTLFILP